MMTRNIYPIDIARPAQKEAADSNEAKQLEVKQLEPKWLRSNPLELQFGLSPIYIQNRSRRILLGFFSKVFENILIPLSE